MKKIAFIPFLFLVVMGYAQTRIVVQNGTASIYSTLNDAISAANPGDTIYLPGLGFALNNPIIDKTLHWVGTGHYPDSTVATGQTRITTNLTFTGNCDNSSFEGICFTGSLNFGSSDDDAENISIKKCRIRGDLTLRGYESDTLDVNFHINESVTGTINARYASNCLIEKTLIFGSINKFLGSSFNYNTINANVYSARVIQQTSSCRFRNNIFSYHAGLYQTESCEFSYNLFAGGLPYDPVTSTHSGDHNITGVGSDNIFTTITDNVYTFSYDNDYHLQVGCPGTDAAEDGTDIGIYGSSLPYKEGAVPFYPHVRSVDIDNAASDGQLGVKVTVAAQER